MYQDIDQVIAEDIGSSEKVIEGKGKICDRPLAQELSLGEKIRQVPYIDAIFYGMDIVKGERHTQAVAIDTKRNTGYENQREPR